jgi:hypothetical protein
VRKEQREMWAAVMDLYLSLEGSGASGRVAGGGRAAGAVAEEFPVQATAVSCCGITDMNNTKGFLILYEVYSCYRYS